MLQTELDDYPVRLESKYTFFGVLDEFYDEIFSRCNDSTRSQYNSQYNRNILPNLKDAPLENYDLEDFEKLVDRMQKEFCYSQSTQQHLRYLLRTVVKMAAQKGVCPDILFGSVFGIPDEENGQTKEKEFVRLRKSLKISEEMRIAEKLLTDPCQDGQGIGLALMFSLGLRNAEACGLDYSAIKPMESHPDCNCIWLLATTVGESSDLKKGGKTKNAPRILPLPQRLNDLLLRRKAWLQKQIDSGNIQLDVDKLQESVEDLPIVCFRDQSTVRCRTRHLSTAGRLLLKEVQVDEEELVYIDRDLQNLQRRIEMGVVEKDPTAYLLRRNLGTHLYILGLSEAEIQYFMGHEIEDPYMSRNDFNNEERLYLMKQKLDQRPLLNDVYPRKEILCGQAPVSEPLISEASVHVEIPEHTAGELHLHLSANEPWAKVRVQSTGDSEGIAAAYHQMTENATVFRTANVLPQYQAAYRRKYDRRY